MADVNEQYKLVNIGPIMVPSAEMDPNRAGSYGYFQKAYNNMNNFEYHSGSKLYPGFVPSACGIEIQTMKW